MAYDRRLMFVEILKKQNYNSPLLPSRRGCCFCLRRSRAVDRVLRRLLELWYLRTKKRRYVHGGSDDGGDEERAHRDRRVGKGGSNGGNTPAQATCSKTAGMLADGVASSKQTCNNEDVFFSAMAVVCRVSAPRRPTGKKQQQASTSTELETKTASAGMIRTFTHPTTAVRHVFRACRGPQHMLVWWPEPRATRKPCLTLHTSLAVAEKSTGRVGICWRATLCCTVLRCAAPCCAALCCAALCCAAVKPGT